MEEQATIDRTGAKAESGDERPTGSKLLKTAVVAVHGMGEQRPMDTLWGLVEALWIQDRDVCRYGQVYPKPDKLTGSFELRRITTVQSKLPGRKRVDFFELYWAHLMRGNTVGSVLGAAIRLLNRPRSSVPPRLVAVWEFASAAVVLIGVAYLAALLLLPRLTKAMEAGASVAVIIAFAVAWAILFGLRGAARAWLGPVAGDAARYLSPDPENVAARQSIREAAVDFIEALHRTGDYDRIVVIGHSLGTVVAYDALTFAWGRIDHSEFEAAHQASPYAMSKLQELEEAADRLRNASDGESGRRRVEYRTAQRRYHRALSGLKRADGAALWLVSDFVTTASPLSKADVLMARDAEGWARRRRLRDVPTCPPQFEKQKPPRFSFPARANLRSPHHAAAFGPTVWTNIYFQTEHVILGDVIAGPLAPLFGRGVLDVRLGRGDRLIRHLDYWREPKKEPPHPWIKALRRAVDLRELQDEDALWSDQAADPEVVAEQL